MPDYDAPLIIPKGHETGTVAGLWTPTGLTYLQSWVVGTAPESMQRVYKHEFELTYLGVTKRFSVLAEEDDSDAWIEDAAATLAESTAKEIRLKEEARAGRLHLEDMANPENWDVRRDLAGALREFFAWRRKRSQSTTGKTVFTVK